MIVVPKIVVDSKEATYARTILMNLKKFGAIVKIMPLTIGDYVASKDVGIERKTVNDFLNTLTKRDLFTQVLMLREVYPKAILILEGNLGSVLRYRKVHPNSVYGAIASIVRSGIAVVPTASPKETARFLYLVASQEQREEGRRPEIKVVKKVESLEELQILFLSSLPRIGHEKAVAILKMFKTPMNAINNFRAWRRIRGIGEDTIRRVERVLMTEFKYQNKEE
ncbi:MAG: hypothetical protein DRJ49_04125 [Thermoprotei archaeon]|nr:MAG: hypothetical protein DRJ49_04125 [Thermoprotei archaeon]